MATPTKNSVSREKHPTKKQKRSHLMLRIFLGYGVLFLAIIYGARWIWREQANDQKNPVNHASTSITLPEKDIILLEQAMPLCSRAFYNFLAAGSNEQQNQFVLSPITTATLMERFSSLNSRIVIDPQNITLSKNTILHIPGRQAIETYWNSSDGYELNAVFMEESGEWRLDWEHFIRFSDYPWPLFLAGSGPEQGEFRLLARERLAEERKNADTISILLYAPRFGSNSETGAPSPEFLIKRDSKNGRLLSAAFKLEKAGKRVFGVNLPAAAPEEFIQVRMKIRRIEEAEKRSFEIDDVLACHWYSNDAPGLEITGLSLTPKSAPPASPPAAPLPDTNAETPAPPAQ